MTEESNVKDMRPKKLAQIHLSRDAWNNEMRIGLIFGVENCNEEDAEVIVMRFDQRCSLEDVQTELLEGLDKIGELLNGHSLEDVDYRTPA